jgi:ubiquinone/menaquinone biosynthesis C-methylase UbiE
MRSVNYDLVAPAYDRRYANDRFDEVRPTLRQFIGDARALDVLEIGCGTGHWLQEISGSVATIAGLDPSPAMLAVARTATNQALLIQGEAEHIPWRDRCVDRVFSINAMHHFHDKPAFVREVRRILRPGGAVMIAGLDPHSGLDQWWVYDYFPSALPADRARYSSAASIRALLGASGFVRVVTAVAQHIPAAVPFERALAIGLVDRRATSQLMVIGDDEFEAGMDRLRREQPILRADLRLLATVGWTET